MPEQQLLDLLEQLHDQLDKHPTMTAEEEARLRQLVRDIHHAMPEDQVSRRASIAGRLADAVERLEQSHPTVSFTLQRLIDTLAKMGI